MTNIAALESVLSTAAIAAASAMRATSAASIASMLAISPVGRTAANYTPVTDKQLVRMRTTSDHYALGRCASIDTKQFRINAGRTRTTRCVYRVSDRVNGGAPGPVPLAPAAHAPTTADPRNVGAISRR